MSELEDDVTENDPGHDSGTESEKDYREQKVSLLVWPIMGNIKINVLTDISYPPTPHPYYLCPNIVGLYVIVWLLLLLVFNL